MKFDNERLRQYIENSADLIEEHGIPRMACRIMGALIVCVPPQLSHGELAALLQASKGSIGMSTQLLLRLDFVERISFPGHRRHYYRLRKYLWNEFLSTRAEHIQKNLKMVDDGLALLENEPIEAKLRLIELQIFSDFVLETLPELEDQWERRRPDLMKKRLAELS